MIIRNSTYEIESSNITYQDFSETSRDEDISNSSYQILTGGKLVEQTGNTRKKGQVLAVVSELNFNKLANVAKNKTDSIYYTPSRPFYGELSIREIEIRFTKMPTFEGKATKDYKISFEFEEVIQS